MTVTNATSFSFTGGTGDDRLIINNPSGGLFAPTNGITYLGGGDGGDELQVLGGSGSGGSYTPTDDKPDHSGTLVHTRATLPIVVQSISFTGLAPVVDTVPAPAFTIN